MYGQYVDYHGIRIFVFGLPRYTEKEWQKRAKEVLQLLADQSGGYERWKRIRKSLEENPKATPNLKAS